MYTSLSSAIRLPDMDDAIAALQEAPPFADGKRRLIEAALKLGARGVSLSALGLRELAREADLNHNTFYRHFHDLDELGATAAEHVAAQVMAGMHEVRRKAARHADATKAAVDYFLDFVKKNPDPFIVGQREVHSLHSPMRGALLKVVDRIAEESVDQIVEGDLVPNVEREALKQATLAITWHMFGRALDYLENPSQRRAIAEQMTWTIRAIFLGAAKQALP